MMYKGNIANFETYVHELLLTKSAKKTTLSQELNGRVVRHLYRIVRFLTRPTLMGCCSLFSVISDKNVGAI